MIKRMFTKFGVVPTLLGLVLFSAAAYAAGTKISDLVSGSPLQGTDAFPIQRGSSNYKGTIANINTYVQANQDAELQAIAGVSSAANSIPYFTGVGTASIITTNANKIAAISNDYNFLHADKYRSGWYYAAVNAGDLITSNGANTLSNDTIYLSRTVISAPITISRLIFKTSSANASSGASLKAAIYASNGTDGKPGSLLGYSTTATSIGDSAVSTVYEVVLDSAITLQPGVYYLGAVLAHTTTGSRWVSISTATPAIATTRFAS